MPSILELRRYRTLNGHIPVSEWLKGLDNKTAARIAAYVDRMKHGNLGNSRSVGEGVAELKINFGSGYRVYYLRDGEFIVWFFYAEEIRGRKRPISVKLNNTRKIIGVTDEKT